MKEVSKREFEIHCMLNGNFYYFGVGDKMYVKDKHSRMSIACMDFGYHQPEAIEGERQLIPAVRYYVCK